MFSCCRVVESIKPKVWKPAKPKPYQGDGVPLRIVWVPKADYETFKKTTGRDYMPMGLGKRGSKTIIIREGYVPAGYRVDSLETYDHQHYWERLKAMPVVTDKAQELHLHECGHTIKGWRHDEGNPVMDGPSDGSRVSLGKRLPEQEDRESLFKEFLAKHPCVVMEKWTEDFEW